MYFGDTSGVMQDTNFGYPEDSLYCHQDYALGVFEAEAG